MSRLSLLSQRREDHQDLVSGIAGGEAELAGPTACDLPAEPGIEVFESHSAAGREMELLKAHLVSGHLPEPMHESRPHASTAVCKLGLQMVNGPPMSDQGIGIAAEDDPSRKAAVDAGQQQPTTLRVEAGSE